MGALTRVLSEEYKKSVELCYNILRAFLVRGVSGRAERGRGAKGGICGAGLVENARLPLQ